MKSVEHQIAMKLFHGLEGNGIIRKHPKILTSIRVPLLVTSGSEIITHKITESI